MKNRKSKHLSFCQRLASELDPPAAKTKGKKQKRAPPPPILALPAEIRQQILYAVIDDDDLLTTPVDDVVINLSKVCQAFSEDVTWVSGRWAQRRDELRAEHRRVFGGFIQDLLTSNGLTLGKLTSSQTAQTSSHQAARASDVGPEAVLKIRPLADRPFKDLDKWRMKRLEDARREKKAFDAGNLKKGRNLRRIAGSEKKRMKFDRLTFLPPDEQRKFDEEDGEYSSEVKNTGAMMTSETPILEDSSGEQPRKDKVSMSSKKKTRSDKLTKKAREAMEQRLEHDRLVGEGQIMRSADLFLGSVRTRPEGMSRKDFRALRRAAKWAKRSMQSRVDAMEEEWSIKNPEAAERRDARLRLRAAYGDYKGQALYQDEQQEVQGEQDDDEQSEERRDEEARDDGEAGLRSDDALGLPRTFQELVPLCLLQGRRAAHRKLEF